MAQFAPILLSARGITSEREPTRLKTGHLLYGYNLDFTIPGLVQKPGGSAKSNSVAITAAPAIMGGAEFWATDALQRRVVATADGKLYKDDLTGAFATTLASGLDLSRVTYFAQGGLESTGRNRLLFAMNGYDKVQVLSADGLTTSDLATPPADWNAASKGPAFMFRMMTSAGQMMGGGGTPTNLDYLYGSSAADHTVWTGTVLGFNVYPGLGRKLVAGRQAFGRTWLWKWPRGIFWIDESAAAVTGWFAKIAHEQLGAAPTPWAVTQIMHEEQGGPVAFVNQAGQMFLMEETSGTLSGVNFVNLCARQNLNLIDTIATEFNKSRFNRVQLHWYEDKNLLIGLYAAIGASAETRQLVIDMNDTPMRAHISTKDTNEAMWFEQDADGIPRPIIGDNAGFVWKLDQTTRTVDGAGYGLRLRTSPTDFSDVKPEWAVKKAFIRLHLEFEPVGNFDVTAKVYIDGVLKGTVTFNMGSAGSVLPFALPGTLGGNEVRRRYKDIGADGWSFSVEFTESGVNNPRLCRAWVEFEPLGMVA